MYQKILVPLDGSELAECVLPHVKTMATACDIRQVVLLRVVEPLSAGTPSPLALDFEVVEFKIIEKARMKTAEEYLARIEAQLSKEGLSVEAKVLTGKPAETISEFAEREKVDLIAIATHGLSGVSRWVFGSVADKIMRSASAPVLLIRPKGCESGR
jgi:nucleotide-binding universal stress UspA family protein